MITLRLVRLRSALALVSGLALLAGLLAATPALAVDDVTPARVAGGNRIATAVAIADEAHPLGTDRAVVATAVAPQDALTGMSLAGALDAALLLVYPDRLPSETAAALENFGVEDVVIVGGIESVSEEVAAELASGGRQVSRIAGADQYETAREVAEATLEVAALPVVDGSRTMLLANGEGFADALAGSPIAYAGPTPVLYTEQDRLGVDAAAFISAADVEQVVILGGPAAISEDVADDVEQRGASVVRLGGDTRVSTSTIVADWAADELSMGTDDVMLARGDDFPDSITAGQLGGAVRRPLVVAATPDTLSPEAARWFAENCATIEVIQAVGGTVALSMAVLEDAEQAAESCDAGGQPPGPGGDDALPDFTVSPLPLLATGVSELDTIDVTDLGDVQVLDVVLFPCDQVEVDGDGSAVFTDGNDDGRADGFGTTGNDAAVVTGINFVDVPDAQVVRDVEPEEGRLGIQVSSGLADCAVVAAIPAGGDDALPVGATGRPTVPYGVTVVEFGDQDEGEDPPEPDMPASQVYRVDPAQQVQISADETATVTVSGRFDGRPITRSLSVILFPCDENQVLGSGPDTFNDADGDGGADGFETTETGLLAITSVNGADITPSKGEGPISPVDGRITVEIGAADGTADCATVVAIAGNGNGKFDLDADGVPVEPYGLTQVRLG